MLPIRLTLPGLCLGLASACALAADYKPEAVSSGRVDSMMHLQQQTEQVEAEKINDVVYKATGFGNTFMVVTDDGNVIIDTSLALGNNMSALHKRLLSAVDDSPVHSIILTHGHDDHTGGVELWKGENTRVIGQQNMIELLNFQHRLASIFNQRNRAQYGYPPDLTQKPDTAVQNFAAPFLPDTTFDDHMHFTLGGVDFQLLHTPSETYDASSVWLPQYKTAFIGDMYYDAFPNMYTLRGTKPRWALDYVASINRILELQPETLLPSHGPAIYGKDKIRTALTHYRDAIQYVHDQTVLGMNQGKDVYTLMREIKLPDSFGLQETYGRVAWSVRGIYEGYLGWFDGQPVNMYDLPPEAIYPELVALAGGPKKVLDKARTLLAEGDNVRALRLVEAAISAQPDDQTALTLKIEILTELRKTSNNLNESGWLNFGIIKAKQALGN